MQNARGQMARSMFKMDRFRSFSRDLQPVTAFAARSVKDSLLEVIAREFRPLRFAAEYLARAANKTPRAAKNWLSGVNAPDAEALIELMASCSSIADEVERLVAERRAAREQEKCPGLKSKSEGSDLADMQAPHLPFV
ncbi:hypothetical protein HW509_10640 [Asaia spathodeae]|uniref:hypothetical protein n=1 Tax=Asaia spathodeae TaxID=657016 RepID=UPI002FC28438